MQANCRVILGEVVCESIPHLKCPTAGAPLSAGPGRSWPCSSRTLWARSTAEDTLRLLRVPVRNHVSNMTHGSNVLSYLRKAVFGEHVQQSGLPTLTVSYNHYLAFDIPI